MNAARSGASADDLSRVAVAQRRPLKHAIFILDGAADRPVESLGGPTPLEIALTPTLDRMAREGTAGLVRTIPL